MEQDKLWMYGFVVDYWEPYERVNRVSKGHIAATSIKAATNAVIEYFAGNEPDYIESITVVALDNADDGIYVIEDDIKGKLLN